MKVTIFNFNNLALPPVYEEVVRFVSNASSGKLKLEFQYVGIDNPEPPLTLYGEDSQGKYWGISFPYLESLPSTTAFTQAIHEIEGAYRILSLAKVNPKGERQISQVYGLHWSTPMHELAHNFYAYLGLPDRVHDIILEEKQWTEPAYTKIIESFQPYYSVLEGENMVFRFPLTRRKPIYRAGFNAIRTDPRNGRKFRHEATDYVGKVEPLYASMDCNVSSYREYQGGLWIIMDNGIHRIEVAHNVKVIKTGQIKRGELIGIAGTTNRQTAGANWTSPHVHVQVLYKGNRLDPELFPWLEPKFLFPNFHSLE